MLSSGTLSFLVGDSSGDRSRGPEGRDEGRMLARASRHHDHDVSPVASHPRHRTGRSVLEPLGVNRREAVEILLSEAQEGNGRLLPYLTPEVVLAPPGGGGGGGVLGSEDDQGLSSEIDVVRAYGGRHARHRGDDIGRSGRGMIVDIVRRFRSTDGHRAFSGREASLDR